MSILLTITYIFVFLFIISKLRFAIPTRTLQFFFMLKLVIGGLYAFVHYHFYTGDTWAYFKFGKILFNEFHQSPIEFFKLTILPRPSALPEKWTKIADIIPYWHQSSGYTMIRLQAILNFFSFGNYPVHIVFWNFFSTIGLAYVYEVINQFFKTDKKILLFLIFLLPSFLFWGSGVHKEAICFFTLGAILYHTFKLAKTPFRVISWCIILFSAFLLLLIRPYSLILFLPILIVFTWHQFNPKYTLLKYAFTYIASIFLAWSLSTFSSINVFEKLRRTQEVYALYYIGKSDFDPPFIQANLSSIIAATPVAIYNVILRPTFNDIHNFLSILAFIETYLIISMFIYFIYNGKFVQARKQVLFYGFLFFSISYIILIGITIDNVGAIVRYRSVPYLFLLSAFWMLYSEKKSIREKK